MTGPAAWITLAGWLQLSLLVASASVPLIFDWRGELAKVTPFLRRLFWVYGAFIVLMIAGFGVLAIRHGHDLVSGEPLARSVSGFICLFWTIRLGVQACVFDVKPYVTSRLLLAGYHLLTLIFIYLIVAFGAAALGLIGP